MTTKLRCIYTFITLFIFSCIVSAQTDFQKKKLRDLAEIYGVIRYFHASDQAINCDWESFLLYSVNETLKTTNNKEFEKLIKSLLERVAPSVSYGVQKSQLRKNSDTTAIYWLHKGVGLGTINPKNYVYESTREIISINRNTRSTIPTKNKVVLKLSDNLTINIPIVIYGEDGKLFATGKEKKISIEKEYPYIVNAVSNIIITWNVFRHFYPYQEEIKIHWKSLLNEGIDSALKNKNDQDHLLTLLKFTEPFKDGHINVMNRKFVRENYAPPIILTTVNRKLVVKKVLNDSLQIQPGSIVKYINSVSSKKLLDSLKQYKSGSPQLKTWISLKNIITGEKDFYLNITFSNNKSVQLKRTMNYFDNRDLFERESVKEFNYYNQDILYINWNKLTKSTFLKIQPQIELSKKIIIDVRGYPDGGGEIEMRNTYFPNKNKTNLFHLPIIIEPFYKNITYQEGPWNIESDKSLSAKIVLLVDERCVSYPESLAQYLKYNNYATIIGRPTGGANGNINKIKLLNGFWFFYTGMLDKNPDNSKFHARGVIPDIHVNNSIKDIINGKDSILERALKFLQ